MPSSRLSCDKDAWRFVLGVRASFAAVVGSATERGTNAWQATLRRHITRAVQEHPAARCGSRFPSASNDHARGASRMS